ACGARRRETQREAEARQRSGVMPGIGLNGYDLVPRLQQVPTIGLCNPPSVPPGDRRFMTREHALRLVGKLRWVVRDARGESAEPRSFGHRRVDRAGERETKQELLV